MRPPGSLVLRATLARVPLICLAVFCIGLAVSRGLSYADDAWFACVAKSLATGHGYSTPWGPRDEAGQFVPFNPRTGVGPTIILPISLGILLFGSNSSVPGLAVIAMWFLLLISIGEWISKFTHKPPLIFYLVTASAILCVFGWHIEIWTSALGEAVAALATVFALLVFASGKKVRDFALAGLLFGVGIQAKIIVVFALPAFVVAAFFSNSEGGKPRIGAAVRSFAPFVAGCCAPIVLVELWKILTLGGGAYVSNWQDYLSFIHSAGIRDPNATTYGKLLELVRYRFGIIPGFFGVLLIAMPVVSYKIKHPEGRTAALGCSVAVISLLGYWFLFSDGRDRYATVGLAIAGVTYGLILSHASKRHAMIILALAVACHAGGFSRLNYAVGLADRGLYRKTNSRLEREQVVSSLEAMIAGGQVPSFGSQVWATFADIAFEMKEPSVIGRLPDSSFQVKGGAVIVTNKNFYNPAYPLPKNVRLLQTLHAGGTYQVERIGWD